MMPSFSSRYVPVWWYIGVVALLNHELLAKGEAPLGFLNPWLCANPQVCMLVHVCVCVGLVCVCVCVCVCVMQLRKILPSIDF